jgi:hypothetical protein
MTRFAALLAAVLLSMTAAMARATDQAVLRVGVALAFTGPPPSAPLVRALKGETAARWSGYGVRLVWNSTATCDAADMLAIVVIHRESEPAGALGTDEVLGTTHIDEGGVIAGPIDIWEPAVRSVLAARPAEQRIEAALFPAAAETELGRALGRVLAHELGHVLLAAPTHRKDGLMRARFRAGDLGAVDPSPFALTGIDIARLRSRLPVILAAPSRRSNAC